MTQQCKHCGKPIPFEACPTCPPRIYLCTKCGTENLVEPAPLAQVEDVIKRFKERQVDR